MTEDRLSLVQRALVEPKLLDASPNGVVRSMSANLSDSIKADIQSDCTWRVLHTKPRQEKAIARTLAASGIRHFLPTIRETKIYGHRKRIVDRPLFASYVFLNGTREEAWFAVGTRRVAQVIEPPDPERLAIELEQIRIALAGQATLDPYPYLKAGKRVRVCAGPFKGVEGVVDIRKRQDRLILKVESLGRAVCLEIDAGLLEPMD